MVVVVVVVVGVVVVVVVVVVTGTTEHVYLGCCEGYKTHKSLLKVKIAS